MNQVQPNCEETEEVGKVEIESVINGKVEDTDELHNPADYDYVVEHTQRYGSVQGSHRFLMATKGCIVAFFFSSFSLIILSVS